MARLSFSYVMLLLFFFLPHSCATASDLRKRKTPSVRSSHLISPGFRSGFSRMSLMNSHKWVPLWSAAVRGRIYKMGYGNLNRDHNIKTVFFTLLTLFFDLNRMTCGSFFIWTRQSSWLHFVKYTYLCQETRWIVDSSPALGVVGDGPIGLIKGSKISKIKH